MSSTETKWTRPPWGVTGIDRQYPEDSDWPYETFFSCYVSPAAEDFRGDVCRLQSAEHIDGIAAAETEANAHLIAAAPELYDACAEFVRKVDAGLARSTKSYEQMVSALAKARGESQ